MKKLLILCALLITLPSFYSSHEISGGSCSVKYMVYILPYRNCTDYWANVYGDRIYYYVYGNVSNDRLGIERDFENISTIYDGVIIVIPAEDIQQYFWNLNVMNSIAEEKGLFVIYAIFPKEKYGDEDSYIDEGTPMHNLVLYDMNYIANLSRTYLVAVWYGWSYRCNATDIVNFYNSLPENLKDKYAVWLDEEYADKVKDVYRKGLPENVLIITEAYDWSKIESYSILYLNQMLVTGYEGASSPDEWKNNMENLLSFCRTNDIGIWIFYDIGDGAGEEYAAFINETLTDFNFTCNLVWEKNLHHGWNLVTLPVESNYKASSLYTILPNCSMILAWNASLQDFIAYAPGSPNDFFIQDGYGYFIAINNGANLMVRGLPIESVNITLYEGWNALGWFKEEATTARSIYKNISNCSMVLTWNASMQDFIAYMPGSPYNPSIRQGDGFFVAVSQQSQWHGEG